MDMSIRFPWPGLYFDYVPKGIHLAGTEISLYGLLIAAGMLVALCFILLEARRNHRNPNHYLVSFLICTLTGIVGARLYYVLFYWSIYGSDPMRILNIREGGLAFYGALAGGILGLLLSCLFTGEKFARLADTFCLGLLAGQFIGRWGDFFNRSSFGDYTTWPTAMQLPLSAVHTSEVTGRIRENMVILDDIPFIQVHPAFLYESLWCFLLLLFLLVRRRKMLFDGEVFLRYLCGYSLGRIFIEWLRTDKLLIPGTDLDINLLVSIGLFVLSLLILLICRAMAKKRINYRRQRQELKYQFEEQLAAEEDQRGWKHRERSDRPAGEKSHQAGIPDDVLQAMEELEEENRQMNREAAGETEADGRAENTGGTEADGQAENTGGTETAEQAESILQEKEGEAFRRASAPESLTDQCTRPGEEPAADENSERSEDSDAEKGLQKPGSAVTEAEESPDQPAAGSETAPETDAAPESIYIYDLVKE